jgi:hypothetical protein
MCRLETQALITTNYPIFYLSEAEMLDPHLVLRDFFSFGHLPETRQLLWLFYKMLVTGNYVKEDALTPLERYHLALLYEYLLKLMEAGYVLSEKQRPA